MMIFKNVYKNKIKSNNDKRGFFREIFKLNCLDYKSSLKQISHSYIKKNILKGWHFHKKQTQWNYLVQGKIIVFLVDKRKNSKTFKKVKSFILDSEKKNYIYCFPPNIGHAYFTLKKNNHMIYGTSGYYDLFEEYKELFDKKLLNKTASINIHEK